MINTFIKLNWSKGRNTGIIFIQMECKLMIKVNNMMSIHPKRNLITFMYVKEEKITIKLYLFNKVTYH